MSTDAKSGAGATDAGWDTYWQGTADAQAFSAGGASHPAIGAFWNDIFTTLASMGEGLPLLDIASGNGAVIASALNIYSDKADQIHCVDLAPAAIENIKTRFPGVNGLVCDAASIPLDPESFRLVTSQFGVEYAGEQAFAEAARMLAPGGQLALLVHVRDGLVARECSVNLQAIKALDASGFIPLAAELFRCGFEAIKGGSRTAYENAAQALAPALGQVEDILRQHGTGVAGDSIVRLYNDVGRIHERMTHYQPEEVSAWLARMEPEMHAYARRMESMISSALDEEQFHRACQAIEAGGCAIIQAGPLQVPGQEVSLAWALRAMRPESE